MRLPQKASVRSAAGIASVALLLSACSSTNSNSSADAPGAGPSIKVGTIGEFSGPSSSSQAPTREGLIAWSKAVNASGGINGHKLQLIVKDDQGDAAKSQAILKDLVENDKIVALVGTNSQSVDTSWASYLQEKNIPVVGGSGSTPVWGKNPMYYNQLSSSMAKFFGYLKMGSLSGVQKVYGTYCAELSSCAQALPLMQKLAAPAGVQLVGSASISATAADYSAQCLQMKNSGAQFVVLTLVTNVVSRLVQACSQQGFQPKYSLAAATMNDGLLKLPELEGSLVWDAAFAVNADAAADYRDAMRKYAAKTSVSSAAEIGWSAGKLFEAAVKPVPSDHAVTTADVLNGLNSMKDETLNGLLAGGLTFAAGKPHAQRSCVNWSVIKGGKLVPQQDEICLPA